MALVPMLHLLRLAGGGLRAGLAFKAGYLQGVVFFGLLIWWITPTISQYGQIPLAAAWCVFMALVLFLALFPAIWTWALSRLAASGSFATSLKRHPHQMAFPLAAAALWTLIEWVRSWIFTGFPWGVLGYGLAGEPWLIQSASVWGLWGVTFLAALVNCCLYMPFLGRSQAVSGTVLLALAMGLLLFVGSEQMASDGPKERGLKEEGGGLCACAIQGAFDQFEKWDPQMRRRTVERYLELTRKARRECSCSEGPPLMVWPETAMPFYFQDDSEQRQQVLNLARKLQIVLLTGSPAYVRDGRSVAYLNSAWLISPDGRVSSYSKRHLVPFGEYLPFGPLTSWMRSFLPTAGDFQAGTSADPLPAGPYRVGVLICFESIFPELARQEVVHGANILAVITNDAWFGDTAAPWQHAAMAIFRAVENRRFVIRAANTGISQIISPEGKVLATSGLFRPEFICSMVEPRSGLTFYARHGQWWFVGLLSVIIVTAYLLFRPKMARQ